MGLFRTLCRFCCHNAISKKRWWRNLVYKAKAEEFGEVTAFYKMMCRRLTAKDSMPDGNNGWFLQAEMVAESIKNSCCLYGEENGEIAAACIMNNECSLAYDAVSWSVGADNKHAASIFHTLQVSQKHSDRGYTSKLVEHAAETAC